MSKSRSIRGADACCFAVSTSASSSSSLHLIEDSPPVRTGQPSVLKRWELGHYLLSPHLLVLQNVPMSLAPHLHHALEFLRADVKAIGVIKESLWPNQPLDIFAVPIQTRSVPFSTGALDPSDTSPLPPMNLSSPKSVQGRRYGDEDNTLRSN